MSANTPLNNIYADPNVAAINIKTYGSIALQNATDAIDHAVAQITNANKNATQQGAIYFPPHTYTIKTNCTIPAGVRVVMEKGAQFSVDSGKTLTINGLLDAPLAQVFGGSGTVTVTGINDWLNPMWWGAKNDNTSATATTTAVQAAINSAAVTTFGSGTVTRGTTIYFPPGMYLINSTLTGIGRGVRLLGATRTTGSAYWSASTLKGSMTGATYLIDLGSSNNSDITIEKLTLAGSIGATSGANKSNHCIYGASVTKFTAIDLNIHGWGGSAIRIDAGSDNRITGVQATGCLFGYLDLSAYAGVIELGSIETFGSDCNINGAAGVGAHSNFGSGYMCAGYFTGSLQHWDKCTFAFAQTGVRVDDALQLHRFRGCRFEYNQGYGLDFAGIKSQIIACRFQDNSQDTDNTYAHVVIGRGGGIKGYDNEWIGNRFDSITYGSYKPTYGFDVQAGGGTTYDLRNEFSGNLGTGFNSAMIVHTGVAPIAIAPINFLQAVSKANGETATFNAQAGELWKVTCTGATATIAAPTNPLKGQIATLDILNSSGGGLTITFNAAFKHAGYTDPANGKHRTARFMYDGTNWLLIGDWSADI